MIVDARPANQRFKVAPRMPIGGSSSWGSLNLPAGETLWVGQYDVEAYFYRCGIPASIGRYFCLPTVSSSFVASCSSIGGKDPQRPWYPYLTVMPMGWSWAMWFAQRLHVKAHLVAGFSPSDLIVDGQPAECLSKDRVLAMPYCDNGNIIGLDPELGENKSSEVRIVLESWGF